eukprot:CAMPEP_0115284762 /NCGR_PEP_ID=MMETSP0270-20121206/61069_1 /TAXON_ID=71861 /ORGANISM="Scrippsiella trochoidea, Strain CCMP3099" /LENGTH=67 /DNA_ID=CAMNT_0002701737 /DNA_START=227 /DNA_END=427 /DNA_ORIENTATION=+
MVNGVGSMMRSSGNKPCATGVSSVPRFNPDSTRAMMSCSDRRTFSVLDDVAAATAPGAVADRRIFCW